MEPALKTAATLVLTASRVADTQPIAVFRFSA
jgi:hypothetical protein